MVEKYAEQETSVKADGKLGLFFGHQRRLTQRTTRRCITEDGTLHTHRRESTVWSSQ
jgi:hypothetical protein